MEDRQTIRLTTSEDMIMVFVKYISEALTPAVKETGFDASLEFARGDDNRINALSVTVPHPSWEMPLIQGITGAIIEHQEIVYVSGWPDLCEKLLRVPWFRAPGAAEAPRPAWSYSPTGKLSGVGRLAEVNRLLCSWVFVGNVVRAVKLEFGGGDGRRPGEMQLVHPVVTEEPPYHIYSRLAGAWCESVRLPEHLVTGAALLMDAEWHPAMADWLLNLRPGVRFEVDTIEGRYGCRIKAPHSVLELLENALLCLGDIVVAGPMEYLKALRVDPNIGEKTLLNQVNPDPTMHTIMAAALEELGLRPRPALELPEKPGITFNNYGQTYVTVEVSGPVEDALLAGIRTAVTGGKG